MTELRNDKTMCEHKDFTTETLEIIDRIVKYEREITNLNKKIEQLNEENTKYVEVIKKANAFAINARACYRAVTEEKKVTKEKLCDALYIMFDDATQCSKELRETGVVK